MPFAQNAELSENKCSSSAYVFLRNGSIDCSFLYSVSCTFRKSLNSQTLRYCCEEGPRLNDRTNVAFYISINRLIAFPSRSGFILLSCFSRSSAHKQTHAHTELQELNRVQFNNNTATPQNASLIPKTRTRRAQSACFSNHLRPPIHRLQ